MAIGGERFPSVISPVSPPSCKRQHLKLLERAGLISREKRGREVFISLRPEGLSLVADWVHEYERFWNGRLDEFAGYFSNKQRSKKR